MFHFIEEKEIYAMSKSCRVNKELLIIQLLVASYSSFLLVSMLLRSALKCFTSNYFGKTVVRAASSPSNIPITYFTMTNLLQRLGVSFFSSLKYEAGLVMRFHIFLLSVATLCVRSLYKSILF